MTPPPTANAAAAAALAALEEPARRTVVSFLGNAVRRALEQSCALFHRTDSGAFLCIPMKIGFKSEHC
jgi:hypothetical protein